MRNARQYTLRRVTRRGLFAALALCALAATARLAAHDIPRDIVVHAAVRPEGQQLRVTLRMPIEAIRDTTLPRRPDGSLDAAAAEPLLRDGIAQWILPGFEVHEDGTPLAAPTVGALEISPRDEFTFALAYPIQSAHSRFAIRPGFERLGIRVLTSLTFETPDGAVRAFQLRGDPGLVPLDPHWHQAAGRFVAIGFFHILDGMDHLLFLLCLVIPFRRARPLLIVVTAFTAAHSLALIATAMHLVPDALWFPPLVETLIAGSVLYMAIENVVSSAPLRRRGPLAFGFGLLHGFGFSFALTDTMQFAGAHLLTSLFAFNVGVELGQIAVLLVIVPVLAALFRYGVPERLGIIVASIIVGHVAWHWMAERWAALQQFTMPAVDINGALLLLRIVIAAIMLCAIVWAVRTARARRPASTSATVIDQA